MGTLDLDYPGMSSTSLGQLIPLCEKVSRDQSEPKGENDWQLKEHQRYLCVTLNLLSITQLDTGDRVRRGRTEDRETPERQRAHGGRGYLSALKRCID